MVVIAIVNIFDAARRAPPFLSVALNLATQDLHGGIEATSWLPSVPIVTLTASAMLVITLGHASGAGALCPRILVGMERNAAQSRALLNFAKMAGTHVFA